MVNTQFQMLNGTKEFTVTGITTDPGAFPKPSQPENYTTTD